MMHSITERKKKIIVNGLAVCFWLLLWQAASVCIGSDLLLVSPVKVLVTLAGLITTGDFWATVLFSTVRILSGFVLAVLVGVVLAVLAAGSGVVRALLRPLMVTVKSIPVASFIILALLWLRNTGNLAVFISFLMVLPIVYTNTLTGIRQADAQLLELARLYRVPWGRAMRYIRLPAVLPPFRAACAVGLGLCWKSGVAAEVIGITSGSIGEKLYDAKLLFSTAELLAWTVVIVLLSLCFEKLFLRALDWAGRQALRVTAPRPTEPGTAGPVRMEQVSKGFGDAPVLQDLSLEFPAGEMVCVMGPSGQGKTTLLRVVAGLLKPDRGTVSAGDTRFSAAFQEERLLEYADAVDNVRFVCGLPEQKIRDALYSLGLEKDACGRPVAELSGGQRRRVALARAMLADGAGAVLLDEPFKGLDEEAHRCAARFVQERRQGRTVLVVTHDAQDAQLLQAPVLSLEPVPHSH